MNISSNIKWHHVTVTREHRNKQNGHKSVVIWFTGLSGSGKSTLAHAVEDQLYNLGCRTFVLDGDNIRHGLCGELGFSNADRIENIRRIGEVSKLFVESGIIVLAAFISPFEDSREKVRNLFHYGDFLEIYCNCSLEVCEARDVKGLYAMAREGKLKEFTGIDSPYENPEEAELTLKTDKLTIKESVNEVLKLIHKNELFL